MLQKIDENLVNKKNNNWSGLGIVPNLLDMVLKQGFKEPTSIQLKAIPVVVEGRDIIGIAQTGTGKTLAFGIPLIQQILANKKGRGLIVLPTRELALQVNETIEKVGREFGIRTVVLIGGTSSYKQVRTLRERPQVIIGTPGRIIDHLQQKTLRLDEVSILVLDEADRMFDMGFAPQLNKILQVLPKARQTMLFSATMPDGIVKIAGRHMRLPVRIEIARAGTTAANIEHKLYVVRKDQKMSLLKKILEEQKGSVLVFLRMKFGAKKICRDLINNNISAAEIHSNRSLGQRKEALEGFKLGRYRVLVATDIASRGIDVKGIELVINYDLPENPEDYVHRIGRTGRAGMSGQAISFVLPDQGNKVREIERLTRLHLPIAKLPELPPSKYQESDDFERRSYPARRRRPVSRSGYRGRRRR